MATVVNDFLLDSFLPFFFSLLPFVPFMFGAQGVWDGSLRETVVCLGCTVFGDITWKHSFLKRLGRWA